MSSLKSAARAILMLPAVFVVSYVRALKRVRKGAGFAAQERLEALAGNAWEQATHSSGGTDITMSFLAPNDLCDFRVRTFSTKEPETLDWIDRFGGVGALYDVGANVGLYSVYYAKRHPGHVYAFEPSVFNLSLLARNIVANGVGGRVAIIPLPLTAREEIAQFRLTSLDMGGALSSFGADIGFDGQPLKSVFDYETIGLSLDFMVREGLIPEPPTLLKIDVDGIEHLVIEGAFEVLRAPTLKSVLIEVNSDVQALAAPVEAALRDAAFTMTEDRHGSLFVGTKFAGIGNQIWVRP